MRRFHNKKKISNDNDDNNNNNKIKGNTNIGDIKNVVNGNNNNNDWPTKLFLKIITLLQ